MKKLIEYVQKTPDKEEWCVFSEDGKNMGCYDSIDKAKERLQQIEYFKHKESKMQFINEGIEIREQKENGAWEVVVIQKGKSLNGTYYTEEALQDIADLINEADKGGRAIPCAAYDIGEVLNHLDADLQFMVPEGFPKSTVGWFKNAKVHEEKVIAELHIIDSDEFKWLRDSLKSAHGLGIKKPFGLSIDGLGNATEAEEDGDKVLRIDKITELYEVTIVTHPAAGGEINKPLNEEFVRLVASVFGKEKIEMNFLEKIVEALKAWNAELIEEGKEIDVASVNESLKKASEKDERFKDLEVTEETAELVCGKVERAIGEIEEAKKKDALFGEIMEGVKAEIKEAISGIKPEEKKEEKVVDNTLKEELKEMRKLTTANRVETILAESRLNDAGKNIVRNRYSGSEGIDEKSFREEVIALESALSNAQGGDLPTIEVTEEERDKKIEMYQTDVDILMGLPAEDGNVRPLSESRFSGVKDFYVQLTGDKEISGRVDSRRKKIEESIQTSDFSTMLGTSANKAMVNEYDIQDQSWRKLVNVVPVKDFKQQDRISFGEYANIATVSELGSYDEFATPTEETASYSPTKRGNFISISREAILNDDLGQFAKTAKYIGRAANRTLSQFVYDLVLNYSTSAVNDGTIYDGTALYTSGHANYATDALSQTTLRAALTAMWKHKDLDSKDFLGIEGKYLVVPRDLTPTAKIITETPTVVGSGHRDINPEKGAVEVITSRYLRADTNNWFVVADPKQWDTIEIGFVQGREKPAMFKQSTETDSMVFSHDKISYKIRHEYSGTQLDFRAFYGSIVA